MMKSQKQWTSLTFSLPHSKMNALKAYAKTKSKTVSQAVREIFAEKIKNYEAEENSHK